MDIATVIGFLSGISLVVLAILMGGNVVIFFDLPAIILVCGGTVASTLINYALADVMAVFNTLKNAFVHRDEPPEELIEKLMELGTTARREGILAIESRVQGIDDEFLRRGVRLAVDGATPETIKDILGTELIFTEERHATGQAILSSMGAYAPAFGLLGTLIGLIEMLMTMSDPSRIGRGMATAILTTLYGVFLANVILLPSAGKLRVKTAAERLRKELIIEGIVSIQSGDNLYILEHKLKSFVAPAARDRIGPRGELGRK